MVTIVIGVVTLMVNLGSQPTFTIGVDSWVAEAARPLIQ
jgi:hypothetical protein